MDQASQNLQPAWEEICKEPKIISTRNMLILHSIRNSPFTIQFQEFKNGSNANTQNTENVTFQIEDAKSKPEKPRLEYYMKHGQWTRTRMQAVIRVAQFCVQTTKF